MPSGLYINNIEYGSDRSEDDDDDDQTSLPFPKPLSRAAFLTPDFEPANFLANQTSRFQTLDDLQAELGQLSATIQTELVDLVNDHYEEFLSLGGSLSGGEEQVEGLRVGLMGVERELGVLKERVASEREHVAEIMQLKRDVVREANVGRRLLDIDRRLGELELSVGILNVVEKKKHQHQHQHKLQQQQKQQREDQGGDGAGGERPNEETAVKWGEEWTIDDVDGEDLDLGLEEDNDEEDDDEDEIAAAEKDTRPSRPLARRVEQWLCLKHLISTCDAQHPFLVAEQPRLKRVKDAILRDIDAAIRLRSDLKGKQNLLELRREMED